jgi:VWFA-related protein
MRRTLVPTVAAVCLTLGSGSAQQPGSRKPVFRGGVEVVLIDVTVVDRSGTPVGDLKPQDFHVSVDHKARTIVSAQFLQYERRTFTEFGDVHPASVLLRATPARTPRNVLLVVDEASLEGADALAATLGAGRFLDQLEPDDRIGVVTIPNLHKQIEMSTRRSDVLRTLTLVGPAAQPDVFSRYTIGLDEALEIERGDKDVAAKVIERECSGEDQRTCPTEVLMAARQLALQAHLRGQRSLDALYTMADGLSAVPGPKTVLLISGGMPMPDLRSTTAFSRLERAFAAAQISLYTLYFERPMFQARRKPSPTPQQDVILEGDGIANATSAVGGTFMFAIGALDEYFSRVATEMSGTYVLGVEVATSDRDARPHMVDVKVNRPGLDVRARRQYVIDRPAAIPTGAKPAGPTSGGFGTSAGNGAPRPGTPVRVPAPATTPKAVDDLVRRAVDYVTRYEAEFSGLLAEERSQQSLYEQERSSVVTFSRGGRPVTTDEAQWVLATKRELQSDYLLMKRPGTSGWLPLRDVYQVDAEKIRPHEARLQKAFLEAPATASARAAQIAAESARYDIRFIERSVNVPTLALMFLKPANRTGFVFWKLGEPVVNGTHAWEIGFLERRSPTVVRTDAGDIPAEGSFCIDPSTGRVVRSTVRFKIGNVTSEITVTYRAESKASTVWVPTEMRESYEDRDRRLDCVATYSNIHPAPPR